MAADRSGGLISAPLIFFPRHISFTNISIAYVTKYNFMKICNNTLPLYAHMRLDAYNHTVISVYYDNDMRRANQKHYHVNF